MKKWRNLLIGTAISAVILYLALKDIELEKVPGIVAGAQYGWIAPAVVLITLGLAARAVRWKYLLAGRISATHGFHIMNIGYMLNSVLPLRLGEIARAFLTSRLDPPVSPLTSLSSILVERVIDTLTVLIMLGGVLLVLPDLPPEVSAAGVGMGIASLTGLAVLMLFAFRRDLAYSILTWLTGIIPIARRLEGTLSRLLDGLEGLSDIRRLAGTVLWTGISWALSVATGYVMLFSVFGRSSWTASTLMIATGSMAIAVLATVGSIGPYEYAFIISLVAVWGDGVREQAMGFAVIMHALSLLMYGILGAVGLACEGVSLGQVTRSAGAEYTPTTDEAMGRGDGK